MFALRRQHTGSDFLPLEQQRVVAIACAAAPRRLPEGVEPGRRGQRRARVAGALLRWHRALLAGPGVLERRRLRPAGDALPLPAARCARRALLGNRRRGHRLPLQQLPEPLSLAAPGPDGRAVRIPGRGRASLSNVASLLGLPGKLGFSGAQVWDAWRAGNLAGIRRYCETDVLNTYLVLLAFERMRGRLERRSGMAECARVRELLRGLRRAASPGVPGSNGPRRARSERAGHRPRRCAESRGLGRGAGRRQDRVRRRCIAGRDWWSTASAAASAATTRPSWWRCSSRRPIASSRAARISAPAAAARCSTWRRNRSCASRTLRRDDVRRGGRLAGQRHRPGDLVHGTTVLGQTADNAMVPRALFMRIDRVGLVYHGFWAPMTMGYPAWENPRAPRRSAAPPRTSGSSLRPERLRRSGSMPACRGSVRAPRWRSTRFDRPAPIVL